jgi:hypothetical protein
MSWEDELFGLLEDLEQQAGALFDGEREVELADRSRAEYGRVTLASRIMASVGGDLGVEVLGAGRIQGAVRRAAAEWFLLEGAGQEWVVRTAAVTSVQGASRRSLPEVAWSPVTGLGFGSACRRLADVGERCLVHLVDGSRHDLVLGRVGKDFLEASNPGGVDVLLPFAAVAAVQSRHHA